MARILVIEDNQANMKLASLLLRNVGHSVLCAVDAETGLLQARAELPDLILMDIQLPGMDGLAATALLKSDPATSAIPVIALTAMAMKADQEKSQIAGCDGYMAKPLRYQELYEKIDALLARSNPAIPVESDPSPVRSLEAQRADEREAALKMQLRNEALREHRLILVAEDSELNQKLILQQLALLGHVADVAANGHLALERWQEGSYALLLSDLHMPVMDGYSLTAAIRSLEEAPERLPIIALTAGDVSGEAEHCRRVGMDDYLTKPLQLADLKAALLTWLPSAGAVVPTAATPARRAPASRVVDVSVLERLVGSDPSVVLEFLHDFRLSAAKTAPELSAACANGQAEIAGEQAHKLKSSARAVGALALGDLCAQMETAGRAGQTEPLVALLPIFEKELDALNSFLDALKR